MEVIFKTVVGSKLYGLALPGSDTDYKGVFMPPIENLLPNFEQTLGFKDFTPMERVETVEGTGPDKVESTLFSARYFLKLYLKGNPTTTEIPFAGDKFVTANHLGKEYMKFIRDNLITKHIFEGYYGYFKDQIYGFEKKTGKCREKRQDMIDQFGFDTKMGSHAYRIGVQGIELFKTGTINPTLSGEQLKIAMDIKTGQYDREWLISTLNNIKAELKATFESSSLPEEPDREKASQFIIKFQRDYYGI